MTLDPATAALLDQMAAAGLAPLIEITPAEARERTIALWGEFPSGPDMVSVRDVRLPASGGHVPLRILKPSENPVGVIVFYHGGGWVLGGLDQTEGLGRRLAKRSDCVVVLVDYRLAPEYRFPTAVDDAWLALRWTADAIVELAGDRVPLIVAGDSAGGNLAAVMTHRARDRGGPALSLQLLVYPVTDCDLETTSYVDPANQLLLKRVDMQWFWDHYAPDELARQHPDASPLRASNLRDLPPAVILTAEHDVLRDDGEVYATLLMRVGVPVVHERIIGQTHGFISMLDRLPVADESVNYLADAVTQYLSRGSIAGAAVMTAEATQGV